MGAAPTTRRVSRALPGVGLLVLGGLVWRLVATSRGSDVGWFAVLFTAELVGSARWVAELVLVGRGIRGRGPAAAPDAPADPPCVDAVVVVADEPLLVARAAILAACRAAHVRRVAVVDREGRVGVSELAARLGVAHVVVPWLDGEATVPDLVAGAVPLLVVPPGHVVRSDVVARLSPALHGRGVTGVGGGTEIVNATRRVDAPDLGRSLVWDELIVRRLAAGGGLRSHDGVTLLGAGHGDPADGSIAIVDVAVSRVLAPATVREARHRYARRRRDRRRAASCPTPRPRGNLARVADLVVRAAPVLVVQRMVVLLVAWATLLGIARPAAGPAVALLGYLAGRSAVLFAARRWVEGRLAVPWILDDLRTFPQDLAAIPRRASHRRPPRRTARAPGEGAARVVTRGLDASTAAVGAVSVTGFVHGPTSGIGAAALLVGAVHLIASNLTRRELRRVQFRAWWRLDLEAPVQDTDGPVVVGLSPFGVDVLAPASLVVGESCRVASVLPSVTGAAGEVRVVLTGEVRRAAATARGCIAYVAFVGLDASTEDEVLAFLAVGPATPVISGTGPHVGERVRSTP